MTRPRYSPRYSIILPVLDEAAALPDILASLQHGLAHDAPIEVIVADGGSSDGTPTIAERVLGPMGGRVIAAPRGRARQMNAGAAVASGDVLIFLHADTCLPSDALTVVERALARPEVVGGAFRLRFDTDAPAYRLVAASITARGLLRHVFTGDQAYAIRRAAFERVGGFPDIALMEDFEIVQRLRREGRFVLFPAAVTTSARRHQRVGLGKSLAIMGLVRMLYALGTPPERLRQIYLDIR